MITSMVTWWKRLYSLDKNKNKNPTLKGHKAHNFSQVVHHTDNKLIKEVAHKPIRKKNKK